MRKGLLIGAGYFSDFHLDAWNRSDRAEITCVCDREASKAEAAAAKYDVGAFSCNVPEALASQDFDFIDIVTGPDNRFELIQQLLDTRLPIICQKPLANSFVQARRIFRAVENSPAPFMVHDNFRFQPWYREIKKLIDSGVIGRNVDSIVMRTRMGDGWGPDAYLARQPYFRTMPRLLVQETGVHFIDTFRYLLGEIAGCEAELCQHNEVIVGEDAGTVRLFMNSGAVATWEADRFHESLVDNPRYTFGELIVDANQGSLWMSATGAITIKPLGKPAYQHDYAPSTLGFAGDCVMACQQHFLDVLDGAVECETSPQHYGKTLEAVEAVYKSDRLQQRVQLAPSRTGHVGEQRVVDLSLTVDANMPGVDVSTAKTIDKDGWNATTLRLYSHAGTHMDAPRHFLGGEGANIDNQDLSVCVGPARVINLSSVQPSQSIGVREFLDAAGGVSEHDRLLIRTDWYKRYGTDVYRNRLPRISLELAEWLVSQRVALLGVEPPSVANVNDMEELTSVHQTLFRGGVLIVEGLAHLDKLSQEWVQFIALPLKIAGGDGCPVRAIAIERSESA